MKQHDTKMPAIIDGVIRAVTYYIVSEYTVSSLCVSLMMPAVISGIAGLIIPPLLMIVGCRKVMPEEMGKYFITSMVSFFAVLAIVFLNYFTIKLRLLPPRELSNADGLIILTAQVSFFAANAVSRLVSLCIIKLTKVQKQNFGAHMPQVASENNTKR